jgi:hypothetical protein
MMIILRVVCLSKKKSLQYKLRRFFFSIHTIKSRNMAIFLRKKLKLQTWESQILVIDFFPFFFPFLFDGSSFSCLLQQIPEIYIQIL